MGFFLEWFVTYALNFSLDEFRRNSLQNKLDHTVDKWCKSLPNDCQLVSVAIYFNVSSSNNDGNLIALKKIGDSLDKSILPSRQLIFDALYERWTICRKNNAMQPFFTISIKQAEPFLRTLAEDIETVLLQETNLFNRFMHDEVLKMRQAAEEQKQETDLLRQQIKALHKAIERNNKLHNNSGKVFRPIPYCVLPFYKDIERRNYVLLGIFKIALFKTFKDTSYKKFTCLIHVDPTFYQYDSGKVEPGITLICGEVEFLANCIRMADLFFDKPEEYCKEIDKYFLDPEFAQFNLKFALGSFEHYIPYEIEVDGVTKKYLMTLGDLDKPLPLAQVTSLNAALFVISYILTLPIVVLDFDKFMNNNAMLKFICSAFDNEVRLSNIRVNVDNYDDWDYEYDISMKDESSW